MNTLSEKEYPCAPSEGGTASPKKECHSYPHASKQGFYVVKGIMWRFCGSWLLVQEASLMLRSANILERLVRKSKMYRRMNEILMRLYSF